MNNNALYFMVEMAKSIRNGVSGTLCPNYPRVPNTELRGPSCDFFSPFETSTFISDRVPLNNFFSFDVVPAHGNPEACLNRRRIMMDTNCCTFAIQECANKKAEMEGKWIHAQIISSGLEPSLFLSNHLVIMYGKCGNLSAAGWVFDNMNRRNVFTWNALMVSYVQKGYNEDVLYMLHRMRQDNVLPDKVLFTTVLRACHNWEALAEGKFIHALIVEVGMQWNLELGTALVTMYGKCGNTNDSLRIFNKMQKKDLFLWNAIISAHAQNMQGSKAFRLLQQMEQHGLEPDGIVFLSMLNVCSTPDALAEGKLIHSCILDYSFDSNIVVMNALINAYGKCESVEDAHRVFDVMPHKDMISWNAMISICAQHGHSKEASQVFRDMQQANFEPDGITFVGILNAYANLAALTGGKLIHAQVLKNGFVDDFVVATAVANMYAKGGSIKKALFLFSTMTGRSVISWNTLITAYGQHGQGKEAMQLFAAMLWDGLRPTDSTFISILSSCSHCGLTGESLHYFLFMTSECDVLPRAEHYGCMVDLYGRIGWLDETTDLITGMPMAAIATIWTAFLGACRTHGDIGHGKVIAEHVFDSQSEDSSSYILLSNIYASASR